MATPDGPHGAEDRTTPAPEQEWGRPGRTQPAPDPDQMPAERRTSAPDRRDFSPGGTAPAPEAPPRPERPFFPPGRVPPAPGPGRTGPPTVPRGRSFEELAVLVLDGSGSMTDPDIQGGMSKEDAVLYHLTTRDWEAGRVGEYGGLLARLKVGANREAISVAAIVFDTEVEVRVPPTPLLDFDHRRLSDQKLTHGHGRGTNIGLALETAGRLAQEWLAQRQRLTLRFVTILLMSDGHDTEHSDPVAVAERIQASATNLSGRPSIVIAAAIYGNDSDAATMRTLVTPDPEQPDLFFKRVTAGRELRDFFIRSMRSSSA